MCSQQFGKVFCGIYQHPPQDNSWPVVPPKEVIWLAALVMDKGWISALQSVTASDMGCESVAGSSHSDG
jgi:hypothetical protein